MGWILDSLSEVTKIVSSTNYWFGIVTSIGLIFIRHRIKFPRVIYSGGGSGTHKIEGGGTLSSHRLSLTNSPSFLGYPINRETLIVETARIYDPKKKVYEGGLMRWKDASEGKPFNTEIKVGERNDLYICGLYEKRVHHYAGETINNIELSETLVELDKSRTLEIHITDNLQRRYKIQFKITAEERRNHLQKVNISIGVKRTSADRLRQFKNGFSDMIRAFIGPNY